MAPRKFDQPSARLENCVPIEQTGRKLPTHISRSKTKQRPITVVANLDIGHTLEMEFVR